MNLSIPTEMGNSRYIPNPTPCRRSRREFLWEVGGGFAGLALIDLLSREGFFAQTARAADKPAVAGAVPYLLEPKKPHFAAKAPATTAWLPLSTTRSAFSTGPSLNGSRLYNC